MSYKRLLSSHLNLSSVVIIALSLVGSFSACKTKNSQNNSEIAGARNPKNNKPFKTTEGNEAALRADPNLQLAEQLLKRKLSLSELQAISKAHILHGDKFTDEQIKNRTGKYTADQLQDKYNIMAKAGLKKDEIKVLMDNNIAGFFDDVAQAAGDYIQAQASEAFEGRAEVTTGYPKVFNQYGGRTETRTNWVTGGQAEVDYDAFGNVVRRRAQ